VVGLVVAQVQGPGECVEDTVGRVSEVAALQPAVVVDGDPSQKRYFFTAEPGNPAGTAVSRQARLLRTEPGAAGSEKLTDLFLHAHDGRPLRFWDFQFEVVVLDLHGRAALRARVEGVDPGQLLIR
jgi:hypothetical protein